MDPPAKRVLELPTYPNLEFASHGSERLNLPAGVVS